MQTSHIASLLPRVPATPPCPTQPDLTLIPCRTTRLRNRQADPGTIIAESGRYISHIGPQTSFPVPEGILNYRGRNTIAVAIWATQPGGARIAPLSLKAGTPVLTGRRPVTVVAAPAWTERPAAY